MAHAVSWIFLYKGTGLLHICLITLYSHLYSFVWIKESIDCGVQETTYSCGSSLTAFCTGITRNSYKKRRATGGKQPQYRKKRVFELGRYVEPAA